MMAPLHTYPSILLFGPGTAILPSRPFAASPSRAEAVKTKPRLKRGLVLTGASTAAADRMRSGDLFQAIERVGSWIS